MTRQQCQAGVGDRRAARAAFSTGQGIRNQYLIEATRGPWQPNAGRPLLLALFRLVAKLRIPSRSFLCSRLQSACYLNSNHLNLSP